MANTGVSVCKIYDTEKLRVLVEGLQTAACMIGDVPPLVDEASVVRRVGELTVVGNGKSLCGCCGAGPFPSRQAQTQHYRGPWHTYNLRRRLLGKRSVTQQEFLERHDGGASSTSSESDTDTDEAIKKGGGEVSELFLAATRHCRAYFTNKGGQVLSVYRCLLHHKKEIIGTDGMGQGWVKACQSLLDTGGWAVMMCSGGHFAAAVFRGPSGIPIKHKTFHAYVSRRGQGKAQLTKDAQGNAPRSAGASLRRFNQEKFIQHVQDILTQWKEDLRGCSLILYRAVGPLNQRSLFGPDSPLRKEDRRLRTLPFPTRRPSHKEVLRAHSILSTVEVYESSEVFQKVFSKTSVPTDNTTEKSGNNRNSRAKKTSPVKLDRAKSREVTVRPLPRLTPLSSEDETPCYQPSTMPAGWTETLAQHYSMPEASKDFLKDNKDNCQIGKLENNVNNLKIHSTLEWFDDSVKKKLRRKKKNNVEKGSVEQSDISDKNESKEKRVDTIQGNRDDLERKNKQAGKSKLPTNKISEFVKKIWQSILDVDILNDMFSTCGNGANLQESVNFADPADGNTALHKAAVAQKPEVVTLLLESGADPCIKNLLHQTPYSSTSHADTRVAFRLFQGSHPDMHNYAKANIPGGLTLEMLEQEKEKKAAQKKVKRLKEKERTQEKNKMSKFLELNDKQKMVTQSEKRCFTCGAAYDKPFQYEEFKFCGIRCLQNHRNTRPLKLSAQ